MARPRKGSVKPGEPRKPQNLSEQASREWDRLIGEIGQSGIEITVAHRAALTLAATIAADIKSDWEEIQREGPYHVSPKGGIMAHPAIKRMDALRRDYLKALSVIGLRPAQQAEASAGDESLEELLKG